MDSSLWNDFLSGDDKAYARIYKEYVSDMFSYGMFFTTNRELVKDCIQDVFVNLYTNRSRLGQTDNIRLYLYIALKNRLYNAFHKNQQLYQNDTMEPVFSVEYTIEDRIIEDEEQAEEKKTMLHLLELLTVRQREVIHYRYVEELSITEISKIMQMNYQSVQNLLQRSIKKIQDTLSKKGKNNLFKPNINKKLSYIKIKHV